MTRGLLLVLLLAGCPAKRIAVESPSQDAHPDTESVSPLSILEEGATHMDPSTRGRSLALLVHLSDIPGGGPWATVGLLDESEWVQEQVVDAVAGRLAEPESVAALEGVVRRDTADAYVRSAAALHLAAAGDTAITDDVKASWRAQHEAWQVAPLALAAAVLGDADAIEPLSHALARGDIGLEVGFVNDIGDSGLVALLPALEEGAAWIDDDMGMLYAAARIALGDESGDEALRKGLSDPDPIVRLAVVDALVPLPGKVTTALLHKAKTSGPDVVQWYATLALAARGEGSPDVFSEAMSEDDREVRTLSLSLARVALDSAEGSQRRKLVKAVRRALSMGLADEDVIVRLEALRTLRHYGVDTEQAWLGTHLADEYLSVRVEAAGTLLMARRTPQ